MEIVDAKSSILCNFEDVRGGRRSGCFDVYEADALGPHLRLDVLVLPPVSGAVPLQHRAQLLPLL